MKSWSVKRTNPVRPPPWVIMDSPHVDFKNLHAKKIVRQMAQRGEARRCLSGYLKGSEKFSHYSPPRIYHLQFNKFFIHWWVMMEKKLLIRIDLHVNLWQSVSPLITLSQSFREGWNGEKNPPLLLRHFLMNIRKVWLKRDESGVPS